LFKRLRALPPIGNSSATSATDVTLPRRFYLIRDDYIRFADKLQEEENWKR
jgi:hypothetical protein